jgi:hypothetical protein
MDSLKGSVVDVKTSLGNAATSMQRILQEQGIEVSLNAHTCANTSKKFNGLLGLAPGYSVEFRRGLPGAFETAP